jgi:hypothetical protein
MALFNRKPLQDEPEVIDLTEEQPAPPALEFGYPTPCPSCGGRGYLDGINLNEGVMYQHCPSCFTKWETSEAEIREAAESA